jgi:hypothetical protein
MAQRVGSVEWSGTAANAFSQSIHAFPPDLQKVVDAHQDAIQALSAYAAELTSFQNQAAQALQRAQTADQDVSVATARVNDTSSALNAANGQYLFYRAKVDALELEQTTALATGDQALASQLALQIASAAQARNAASAAKSAASDALGAARSALTQGQEALSQEQVIARQIAASRTTAADLLAHQLSSAADLTVQKRSWLDRVWGDFESAATVIGKDELRVIKDVALTATGNMAGIKDLGGWAEHDLVSWAPQIHAVVHALDRAVDDIARVVDTAAPIVELALVAITLVQPELAELTIPGIIATSRVQAAVDATKLTVDSAEAGSDVLMSADGRGNQVDESQDMNKLGGDVTQLGEEAITKHAGEILDLPTADSVIDGWTNGASFNEVKTATAVGVEGGMAVIDKIAEHVAGHSQ